MISRLASPPVTGAGASKPCVMEICVLSGSVFHNRTLDTPIMPGGGRDFQIPEKYPCSGVHMP